MKITRKLLPFALIVIVAALHAAETVPGPKGGRMLDAAPLRAEFHVDDGGKAEVTFYDADLKPVPPGSAAVTVIAEPASGRVPVELEPTTNGFVSKSPLPEGAPYRVVVQVREKAGARPHNFRIDLNLATCGECDRAEYACICEGH